MSDCRNETDGSERECKDCGGTGRAHYQQNSRYYGLAPVPCRKGCPIPKGCEGNDGLQELKDLLRF